MKYLCFTLISWILSTAFAKDLKNHSCHLEDCKLFSVEIFFSCLPWQNMEEKRALSLNPGRGQKQTQKFVIWKNNTAKKTKKCSKFSTTSEAGLVTLKRWE